MAITINSFEAENVKRIKAVKLKPSPKGLTIIGGGNAQGKTSVLDAIAWALGGNNFKPSSPAREGSVIPPALSVTLSNGIKVERKGKNSDLKVTDPSGQRAGQKLLDEFVSAFALNLPKFIDATSKEKADTLLKIIGVGDRLHELEKQENELYNNRTAIGRIADQKQKFADEMQSYPDVPDQIVSASDLIKQQQDILARNGQRQQWIREYDKYLEEYNRIKSQIDQLEERLHEVDEKIKASEHTPKELAMESTAELEANIADIEEINRKVRANLDKEKAEDDAKLMASQYDTLTAEIEKVRSDKADLLSHADLPLPGLTVESGELVYNGQKWDCMSGSEQLKVATAIVRKLNPNCGFVLMDKLEQMDPQTLEDFGAWCEQENLQVIATRVSTGDECSIIITDGVGGIDDADPTPAADIKPRKSWKKGEF
jgi:AAA15 family ATPase/GTPase